MGHDGVVSPSFIRTKRPHQKSRFGCHLCKQRRIKCDELRPSCTKCHQRGTRCVYDAELQPSALNQWSSRISSDVALETSSPESTRPADENSDQSVRSGSLPSATASDESDQLFHAAGVSDAELARIYLEFTVDTLCLSSTRREQHWIWRVFVPSLAIQFPTVRRGLLTLGAMSQYFNNHVQGGGVQRLQQSHDTVKRYLDVATAHGEIFVKESRSQLDRLRAADVDSNTACTRLLTVLAFAFFRSDRQQGVTLDDDKAWVWIRLLRGVLPVHLSLLQLGHDVNPIIKRDMVPEVSEFPSYSRLATEVLPKPYEDVLAFIEQSYFMRFGILRAALGDGTFSFEDEPSQSRQYVAAAKAIESLDSITHHICKWAGVSSLFRSLCTWIAGLHEEFVQMLVDCQHSALAIYAHWLMLVLLAEDLWWVGDMARDGIRAILGMIPENHTAMHRVLRRPRQVLDLVSSAE